MQVFDDSTRYAAEVVHEGRTPGNYGGFAKSLSEALDRELGFLVVSRWPDMIYISIDLGLES